MPGTHEGEGALVRLTVMLDHRVAPSFLKAPRLFLKKSLAILEPPAIDSRGTLDIFERAVDLLDQKGREFGREVPGTGDWIAPDRDAAGQSFRAAAQFAGDQAPDVRVIRRRLPAVSGMEKIPGRVVVGILGVHRPEKRNPIHLSRDSREMLADSNAAGGCVDGAEGPAGFRSRLRIPGIELTRRPGHPQQDYGLRRTGRLRPGEAELRREGRRGSDGKSEEIAPRAVTHGQ